jgi:hypothetical protein
MAGPIQARFDTREFDATLRKYAVLSKSVPSEICNRKSYYIVRRAMAKTPKAEYAKMAAEIGPSARAFKIVNGKVKRGKKLWAQSESGMNAPALALIINWRRGLKSKPGLYGKDMRKAVRRTWGARARSIAYIKSGWIKARDTFKRLAKSSGRGLPPSEGAKVKQVGKPKGSASPAVGGAWRAMATFTNEAWTKRNQDALIEYGEPPLEQAFAEERGSTIAEVERRLKELAARAGIKTR